MQELIQELTTELEQMSKSRATWQERLDQARQQIDVHNGHIERLNMTLARLRAMQLDVPVAEHDD